MNFNFNLDSTLTLSLLKKKAYKRGVNKKNLIFADFNDSLYVVDDFLKDTEVYLDAKEKFIPFSDTTDFENLGWKVLSSKLSDERLPALSDVGLNSFLGHKKAFLIKEEENKKKEDETDIDFSLSSNDSLTDLLPEDFPNYELGFSSDGYTTLIPKIYLGSLIKEKVSQKNTKTKIETLSKNLFLANVSLLNKYYVRKALSIAPKKTWKIEVAESEVNGQLELKLVSDTNFFQKREVIIPKNEIKREKLFKAILEAYGLTIGEVKSHIAKFQASKKLRFQKYVKNLRKRIKNKNAQKNIQKIFKNLNKDFSYREFVENRPIDGESVKVVLLRGETRKHEEDAISASKSVEKVSDNTGKNSKSEQSKRQLKKYKKFIKYSKYKQSKQFEQPKFNKNTPNQEPKNRKYTTKPKKV